MVKTKHHKKLTAQERDLIALWRGGGISVREIARHLGEGGRILVDKKYMGEKIMEECQFRLEQLQSLQQCYVDAYVATPQYIADEMSELKKKLDMIK